MRRLIHAYPTVASWVALGLVVLLMVAIGRHA